jgi:hypothetical protein
MLTHKRSSWLCWVVGVCSWLPTAICCARAPICCLSGVPHVALSRCCTTQGMACEGQRVPSWVWNAGFGHMQGHGSKGHVWHPCYVCGCLYICISSTPVTACVCLTTNTESALHKCERRGCLLLGHGSCNVMWHYCTSCPGAPPGLKSCLAAPPCSFGCQAHVQQRHQYIHVCAEHRRFKTL